MAVELTCHGKPTGSRRGGRDLVSGTCFIESSTILLTKCMMHCPML